MPNAPTTSASPASPAQPAVASASTAAIPGYENMTFEQRRLAQDQNAAAARRITLARSRT
jgi:hypothetical protein